MNICVTSAIFNRSSVTDINMRLPVGCSLSSILCYKENKYDNMPLVELKQTRKPNYCVCSTMIESLRCMYTPWFD